MSSSTRQVPDRSSSVRTLQPSHSLLTEERVFMPRIWTCVAIDCAGCAAVRDCKAGSREVIDRQVLSGLLQVVMGAILLKKCVLGIREPRRGSLLDSADSDIVVDVGV